MTLHIRGLLALILFAVVALVSSAAAEQQVILPGSVINITVLGNEQLSETVVVNPDGSTDYPVLSGLNISGMSVGELNELLTGVISRLIDRPRILITLSEYKLITVRVKGAVSEPGEVVLKGPADIYDAIAEAGGPTANADMRRVMIASAGDVTGARDVDLVDLRYYAKMPDDHYETILLNIGDLVVVPELKSDSFIRIIGEVRSPGSYVPDHKMTLIDAVYLAGGFTVDADRGEIMLIRQGGDAPHEQEYKFKELADGITEVPEVYPGDVIIVGRKAIYENASFWVEWIRNVSLLVSSYAILQRL